MFRKLITVNWYFFDILNISVYLLHTILFDNCRFNHSILYSDIMCQPHLNVAGPMFKPYVVNVASMPLNEERREVGGKCGRGRCVHISDTIKEDELVKMRFSWLRMGSIEHSNGGGTRWRAEGASFLRRTSFRYVSFQLVLNEQDTVCIDRICLSTF